MKNTLKVINMLKETRLLLKHSGLHNIRDINKYKELGGYLAFKNVLTQTSEEILSIIDKSGLKGRGGAGFSTGVKTQSTSDSAAKCLKYVVCNADEGEPGTFKDRILMEQNPHQIIEGILIAAKAIGAIWGYIYIRGEYYESIEKMKFAIKQAEENNLIGHNILGSDFSFRLEVMIGAGSYLCGEELTLIESIEGKRGYPRIKPPFPAEKGLWQQPTLINNVETLSNLPIIFNLGIDEYLKIGTKNSPGTKLICLSGDIKYPGTYEVEMGSKIVDIINDIGGGVEDKKNIKAILLGGAAGTFANESQLDLPLDYTVLRNNGLTLGSGAIIVISEESSLTNTISSILNFFKHESCGKCVPCRVGTHQLKELWEDVRTKSFDLKISTLIQLKEIAEDIAKSSLCPLGQSPILPIKSVLNNCSSSIE